MYTQIELNELYHILKARSRVNNAVINFHGETYKVISLDKSSNRGGYYKGTIEVLYTSRNVIHKTYFGIVPEQKLKVDVTFTKTISRLPKWF